MYRSSSFDQYLSEKMHDPVFAKFYLLELVDSDDGGLSIEDALREAISVMGVTEFATLVGESKSNIGNFLNRKRNIKQKTLNKYLLPFNLKLKLTLEDAA